MVLRTETWVAGDQALSEPDRRALRERLRSTLPTDADGSIPLVSPAWAVRASVP